MEGKTGLGSRYLEALFVPADWQVRVWFVWFRRKTIRPSVHTDYSSVWVHVAWTDAPVAYHFILNHDWHIKDKPEGICPP